MGSGSIQTGPIIRTALLLPFLLLSAAQSPPSSTCAAYSFSQNRLYANCTALPKLSSFLHWTYNATTGTADIAFRAAASSSSWAAWALGDQMTGAQALVAYAASDGTMTVFTSSIANTQIATLTESPVSFAVADLAAESSGGQIIIFAKITPPGTTVSHVWQVGPLSGGAPAQHSLSSDHLTSTGTINFLSGAEEGGGGGVPRQTSKNFHGVLNAISWGILLPIGFLVARYLKVVDTAAWFYLHIACQCLGYVIGVVGWILGLKLGSESPGVTYHSHRNIGITLFCLATLQMFALLMRPNKDHKLRTYWTVYHRSVGYAVVVLGIANVFVGLDILDPEKKWKTIYIIILIVLACIALFLEATTWVVVLRRKKKGGSDPKNPYGPPNGYNGTRSEPSV